MKTILTEEQTNRLIELGVPANKISGKEYNSPYGTQVFILNDLLDILPKQINVERSVVSLTIIAQENYWAACYVEIRFMAYLMTFTGVELIDAIYKLVEECIKSGYIKFN